MRTNALQIYLRITIAFLVNITFIQFAHALAGPGPLWSKVRKITLSSPATTPSANFQVKVTLTTAVFGANYTNIKADGSDLRFYDVNDNPCNYYIDTWVDGAASNIIWVKVPVAGTGTLYMFYGNTGATAVSNGDNTFIFFDDFNASSLNSAKWTSTTLNTGSSITQNGGGNVALTSGGSTDQSGAQIIGKTSFNVSDGVIVETHLGAAAPLNTGSRGSLCGAYDNGIGSGICYFDLGPKTNWAIATVGRAGVFGHWFEQCNGTVNDVLCIEDPACPTGTNSLPVNFLSVAFTTGTIYYSSSNPVHSVSSNINPPTGAIFPILSSAHNSTIHNSVTITIDYIRLRKFISTGDIATSLGNEVNNNLSASITAQTNVNCNGQSTGSATVTATGASTPYTYLWSNTQTVPTATGLSANTYTVTVTDNIGLTVITQATITQPASAVMAAVTDQSNVTCFAANDGTITVSASGGIGPYTFSIDNGANFLPPTGTNLRLFTGLLPNNPYRIRVKDSNLCISK